MNQIWLILIAIGILITAGFLIALILDLRKTVKSLDLLIKTTESQIKPTLEELQQTLRSLRNVSDDINEVTSDIKSVSGSVRDVGDHLKQVSNIIEEVTLSASAKALGLKAGVKAGLGFLMNNLFSRMGGKK